MISRERRTFDRRGYPKSRWSVVSTRTQTVWEDPPRGRRVRNPLSPRVRTDPGGRSGGLTGNKTCQVQTKNSIGLFFFAGSKNRWKRNHHCYNYPLTARKTVKGGVN